MLIRNFFVFNLVLYIMYSSIWFLFQFFPVENTFYYDFYTDSYAIIAAVSFLIGYLSSRKWGGVGSLFGKALLFLSLSLLLQFLGQGSYAIYHYVFHVDNPYPSFGDVFYISSTLLYIYAAFLMAKTLGLYYTVQTKIVKIVVFFLPLLILALTFYLFLADYDYSNLFSITTVLDFAYPTLGAVFIIMSLLAFVASKQILGGKLAYVIFILLIAFFLQYLGDTIWLYQSIHETWEPVGITDILYVNTYFIMGVSAFMLSRKYLDLVQV